MKNRHSVFVHFVRTYLTALPRICYRTTLSLLIDPTGAQAFVHQVLNAVDCECDDPILGSADVVDIMPGFQGDAAIVGPYYLANTGGTRGLLELGALAYMMRALRPQIVFEIGTHLGRTTRLMLLNAPPECRILTLDLPQSQVGYKIGGAFLGTPEEARIQQMHGDSREFDFSAWRNICDFVWVDACHDYEFVVSDTRNALQLCRSGGWIGWHDYRHTAWWSGVTRAVREFHSKHAEVRHIGGTTIALFRKP